MKSTGLQDSNLDQMPASQKPLGTDKEGTEFAEQWSYSSVVGMLLYLAAKSQQEIAYPLIGGGGKARILAFHTLDA